MSLFFVIFNNELNRIIDAHFKGYIVSHQIRHGYAMCCAVIWKSNVLLFEINYRVLKANVMESKKRYIQWCSFALKRPRIDWANEWMTADVEDNAMTSDLTDCFLKRFFMSFYLQLETSSRFIWIFVNYMVNLEWIFLLKSDAKRWQCRRKKVIREYDERTWWKIERKKDRKLKMKEQKMRVKCAVCIAHIILMCVLMKIVSKSIEQIN